MAKQKIDDFEVGDAFFDDFSFDDSDVDSFSSDENAKGVLGFFKNVSKSIKDIAYDAATELTPEALSLKDEVSNAKMQAQEHLASAKLYASEKKDKLLTEAQKKLKSGGNLKGEIKSTIDQAKTGRFYKSSNSMDMMSLDFGGGDDDYDSSENDAEYGNDNDSVKGVQVKRKPKPKYKPAKLLFKSGAITSSEMAAIQADSTATTAQITMASAKRAFIQNSQQFNVQLKVLENIATNVHTMTSFVSNEGVKGVLASLEYYSKSLRFSADTTSLLKEVRNLNAKALGFGNKEKEEEENTRDKVFGNGFSGSAYIDAIKENAKSMFSNSMFGQMGDMFSMMKDMNEMSGKKTSMFGTLSKMGLGMLGNNLLGGRMKSSLESLNKLSASLPQILIDKMTKKGENESGISGFLGRLLGVEQTMGSGAKMGLKDPRAPMAFDQQTHNTINNVIPDILESIRVNTSKKEGDEERYFDHSTGTFKTKTSLKAMQREEEEYALTANVMESMNRLKNTMSGGKVKGLSDKDVDSGVSTIWRNMVVNNIDPDDLLKKFNNVVKNKDDKNAKEEFENLPVWDGVKNKQVLIPAFIKSLSDEEFIKSRYDLQQNFHVTKKSLQNKQREFGEVSKLHGGTVAIAESSIVDNMTQYASRIKRAKKLLDKAKSEKTSAKEIANRATDLASIITDARREANGNPAALSQITKLLGGITEQELQKLSDSSREESVRSQEALKTVDFGGEKGLFGAAHAITNQGAGFINNLMNKGFSLITGETGRYNTDDTNVRTNAEVFADLQQAASNSNEKINKYLATANEKGINLKNSDNSFLRFLGSTLSGTTGGLIQAKEFTDKQANALIENYNNSKNLPVDGIGGKIQNFKEDTLNLFNNVKGNVIDKLDNTKTGKKIKSIAQKGISKAGDFLYGDRNKILLYGYDDHEKGIKELKDRIRQNGFVVAKDPNESGIVGFYIKRGTDKDNTIASNLINSGARLFKTHKDLLEFVSNGKITELNLFQDDNESESFGTQTTGDISSNNQQNIGNIGSVNIGTGDDNRTIVKNSNNSVDKSRTVDKSRNIYKMDTSKLEGLSGDILKHVSSIDVKIGKLNRGSDSKKEKELSGMSKKERKEYEKMQKKLSKEERKKQKENERLGLVGRARQGLFGKKRRSIIGSVVSAPFKLAGGVLGGVGSGLGAVGKGALTGIGGLASGIGRGAVGLTTGIGTAAGHIISSPFKAGAAAINAIRGKKNKMNEKDIDKLSGKKLQHSVMVNLGLKKKDIEGKTDEELKQMLNDFYNKTKTKGEKVVDGVKKAGKGVFGAIGTALSGVGTVAKGVGGAAGNILFGGKDKETGKRSGGVLGGVSTLLGATFPGAAKLLTGGIGGAFNLSKNILGGTKNLLFGKMEPVLDENGNPVIDPTTGKPMMKKKDGILSKGINTGKNILGGIGKGISGVLGGITGIGGSGGLMNMYVRQIRDYLLWGKIADENEKPVTIGSKLKEGLGKIKGVFGKREVPSIPEPVQGELDFGDNTNDAKDYAGKKAQKDENEQKNVFKSLLVNMRLLTKGMVGSTDEKKDNKTGFFGRFKAALSKRNKTTGSAKVNLSANPSMLELQTLAAAGTTEQLVNPNGAGVGGLLNGGNTGLLGNIVGIAAPLAATAAIGAMAYTGAKRIGTKVKSAKKELTSESSTMSDKIGFFAGGNNGNYDAEGNELSNDEKAGRNVGLSKINLGSLATAGKLGGIAIKGMKGIGGGLISSFKTGGLKGLMKDGLKNAAKGGLKGTMSAIKSPSKIMNLAGKLGKNAAGSLAKGAAGPIKAISNLIEKLLTTGKIGKMLGKFGPKIAKSFLGRLVENIKKQGAKLISKITAKLGAFSIPLAGQALLVAQIVGDFMTGYNSTRRYFKLDKGINPTMAMKLTSGAVNVLSGFCFGIIPVAWCVDMIFKLIGGAGVKDGLQRAEQFTSKKGELYGVEGKRLAEYNTRTLMEKIFGGAKKSAVLLGFGKDGIDAYNQWYENRYKPLEDIYKSTLETWKTEAKAALKININLEDLALEGEALEWQTKFRAAFLQTGWDLVKKNGLEKYGPNAKEGTEETQSTDDVEAANDSMNETGQKEEKDNASSTAEIKIPEEPKAAMPKVESAAGDKLKEVSGNNESTAQVNPGNIATQPTDTIVPHAKGGIVTSPTLFKYGGVKTGIMGEAGPEAIIPLKRDRSGNLGVAGGGDNSLLATIASTLKFQQMSQMATLGIQFGKDFLKTVGGKMATGADAIGSKAEKYWEKAKDKTVDAKSRLKEIAKAAREKGKGLLGSIGDFASNAWNGIKNVAGNIAEGAQNLAGKAWGGITNFASNAWNGLTGTAQTAVDIGRQAIDYADAGARFLGGKLSGVASKVVEGIKSTGDAVSSFLSNPKEIGTAVESLFNTGKQNVINFAKSIKDESNLGQQKSIQTLSPAFGPRVEAFLKDPAISGKGVSIREARRSPLTQLAYYSKGRADKDTTDALMKEAGYSSGINFWPKSFQNPGQFITWTLGSNHFTGNAVDLEPGQVGYAKLGEVAKKYGISWGGYWRTPDQPHFEIDPNWKDDRVGETSPSEADGTAVINSARDLQSQQQADTVGPNGFMVGTYSNNISLNNSSRLPEMASRQNQTSYNRPVRTSNNNGRLNSSPISNTIQQDMNNINAAVDILNKIYNEQTRHNRVAEQFFSMAGQFFINSLKASGGNNGSQPIIMPMPMQNDNNEQQFTQFDELAIGV
jgi:hypothetical protein